MFWKKMPKGSYCDWRVNSKWPDRYDIDCDSDMKPRLTKGMTKCPNCGRRIRIIHPNGKTETFY